MTLVLTLPPELEQELSEDAARVGIPLSEYALRILASNRFLESAPQTGAELIAYWQNAGLVGTRADIQDAPEHARRLRE
jgi:hypothetical protein